MELGIGEVNGAMALGTALGLETGFTRSDRSLDLNDKNELLEHQELQCQASGRYDCGRTYGITHGNFWSL